MMFLLDVNVLLAMSYGVHVHNARVRRWISHVSAEHGTERAIFATCPTTELGFVRVGSGKAAYAKDVDTAREDLEDLKSSMEMLFVPDDFPRVTFRCGFASQSRRAMAICLRSRSLMAATSRRWIDSFLAPCSFPRKRQGRSWCGNAAIRSF